MPSPSHQADHHSPNLPKRAIGNRPLAAAWIIFGVHTLGLLLLFDPISGLWSGDPLINQDYGLHYHHLLSMEGFWKSGHRLWGYNPFFMAGYPSNTLQDLSIKLFEILSLATRWIGLVRAFKLWVFLSAALTPWFLFWSARNFLAKEETSWFAPAVAFIGTAYWWNSYPREMFFYGMIGFSAASYFSIMLLSLFWRVVNSEPKFSSAHLGWLLCVILAPTLHVQSVIMVAVPAAILLLSRLRSSRSPAAAWIIGGLCLSFLINFPWINAYLSHRHDDVSDQLVRKIPVFVTLDPLAFLKDYFTAAGYFTFREAPWEKGWRVAILLAGLAGLTVLWRQRRRELALAFGSGILALFALAYFGSWIAVLKRLQPLRFKVPMDLFLVIPAGLYISHLFQGRITSMKEKAIAGAAFCACAAFVMNLFQTEIATGSNAKGAMTLRTRLSPPVQNIIDWIKSEIPENARLLFEESGDETGFVYDGMYLTSFLPHWTGRELIGGPANLYNDRHHFAHFCSGILFGRDIMSITDAQMREYFKMYNIGAIVAFHPRSIDRLLAMPGLITLDRRQSKVVMLKVHQDYNWLLQGQGELTADWNGLHVQNASGPTVILKYHWIEGMHANPPCDIVPIKLLRDDPIPFVRINNPPPDFTIGIGVSR